MTSLRLLFLAAVLLLTAAGCSSRPAGAPAANEAFLQAVYEQYPDLRDKPYQIAQVKRVVDGDTFQTADSAKVRLIGVDTPESVGKVEHFGKEASEFTKKELTGQTVYLFSDAGDTDKYGRLLRYVFKEGEPLMYNEKLVQEGYANPMTVPPNVLYAKRFVSVEREARTKKVGLWAASASSSSSSKKPASSTAPPTVPEDGKSCSNPQIKGNINAKKESIYHVPGGRSYEQTKAERMFCTEKEAEAAGFRRAKE
ncbi:micrococcal nuclease [Paenibacillus sp. UNCCL117]|uniref:thermonuclease family protein n=1 Tax=unclassified Paenibacillus TaxID=185978 RepID=UPI00087EEFBD|nr:MULTISPECIES: thermonuclease family protein [unclassified Paenibacillus]SDD99105.1 micrococcal nuclease [Paenibacillus sp. cl123]SFW55800.1 micrococcal nuclease [Paenibacillus sp. UNCCL117]